MNTFFRFLINSAVVLVAVVALGFARPAMAQSEILAAVTTESSSHGRPANRIVVMVDRSASFIKNLAKSRDLAWKYIRDIANSSIVDEVYVIGVDNHTAQIAYVRGIRSRRDAQDKFDAAFANATNGRGTDWIEGFRIASNTFALAPKPGACHLLVFGDLYADDEADASGKVIRRFKKLNEFDWSVFRGVNTTMWFVADPNRDTLLSLPSFNALGAKVYTIESEARSKDEIKAPKPVRSEETTNAPADNSWIMWAVGAVGMLLAFGWMMRGPNPNP
jgi:hypothetical protein